MTILKRIKNKLLNITGYELKKTNTYPSKIEDIERLSKKYIDPNAKLKLHFGCGPRILKDWINIDIAYEPFENYLQYYTDTHYSESIRGSKLDFYQINFLNDGIPLPDNSVDIIFHEDFFEHLNQKEQIIFLAETLRVLKPNGVHRINTPNLKASMRDNSDFTKGKNGVFSAEWDTWHHFSIITPAILEELIKIVGYNKIIFNKKNESIIANHLPLEYRPNPNDRLSLDSNVFADLIK